MKCYGPMEFELMRRASFKCNGAMVLSPTTGICRFTTPRVPVSWQFSRLQAAAQVPPTAQPIKAAAPGKCGLKLPNFKSPALWVKVQSEKAPILLRSETLDQPIRMVSRVSICTCRSCLLDLAFLAVLHRANLKQFKFKSFAAKIWDVTVKLKVQIQRLQT